MSAQLTAKVSLDFLHYTPEGKVSFGNEIIPAMTTNSGIFTTPDVSMTDLTAANSLLNSRNIDAAGGDHTAILERNAAEAAWDKAFKTEAGYVSHVAKGDLIIIAKSAFHATHTETHAATRPGKAVAEAFGNKAHGSIHAAIKPLPGSRGTLFVAIANNPAITDISVIGNQITFNINGSPVVMVLSTKHAVDMEGLKTGTQLTLSAIGFNAAGLGDPADGVDVVVP